MASTPSLATCAAFPLQEEGGGQLRKPCVVLHQQNDSVRQDLGPRVEINTAPGTLGIVQDLRFRNYHYGYSPSRLRAGIVARTTSAFPAYSLDGAENVSRCVVRLREPAIFLCTRFVPKAFPEIGILPISGRVRTCTTAEKLRSH